MVGGISEQLNLFEDAINFKESTVRNIGSCKTFNIKCRAIIFRVFTASKIIFSHVKTLEIPFSYQRVASNGVYFIPVHQVENSRVCTWPAMRCSDEIKAVIIGEIRELGKRERKEEKMRQHRNRIVKPRIVAKGRRKKDAQAGYPCTSQFFRNQSESAWKSHEGSHESHDFRMLHKTANAHGSR